MRRSVPPPHAAQDGHLVTFGIVPTAPETGYGYIRKRRAAGRCAGALPGGALRRKAGPAPPPQQYRGLGRLFLEQRHVPVPRDATFSTNCRRLRPDILDASRARAAMPPRWTSISCRLDPAAFEACPSDSIDYAVMEHTRRAAVVPADMGWNDIGAWSALWDVAAKDADGNVMPRRRHAGKRPGTASSAPKRRMVAVLGV